MSRYTRELTDTELAELVHLANDVNRTGTALSAAHFINYMNKLSEETGLSEYDIKIRAKAYYKEHKEE